MIIDGHTHIFPEAVRQKRDAFFQNEPAFSLLYGSSRSRMIGAEQLIAAMDENRVDKAVTFGFPWRNAETTRRHNDYILEAVSRYPDRLVGSASCTAAAKRIAQGAAGLRLLDLSDPRRPRLLPGQIAPPERTKDGKPEKTAVFAVSPQHVALRTGQRIDASSALVTGGNRGSRSAAFRAFSTTAWCSGRGLPSPSPPSNCTPIEIGKSWSVRIVFGCGAGTRGSSKTMFARPTSRAAGPSVSACTHAGSAASPSRNSGGQVAGDWPSSQSSRASPPALVSPLTPALTAQSCSPKSWEDLSVSN